VTDATWNLVTETYDKVRRGRRHPARRKKAHKGDKARQISQHRCAAPTPADTGQPQQQQEAAEEDYIDLDLSQ